jgi:hypothetical protein
MEFIKFPDFYTTHQIFATAEEIEEHTMELARCPGCGYVIGSNGTCENNACTPISTDTQQIGVRR